MKKYYILIFIAVIITSCKVYDVIPAEKFNSNFKGLSPRYKIDNDILLDDYSIYVYKLCEQPFFNTFSDADTETNAFPLYGECIKREDKIVEETYLLMPKNSDENPVIYLTTLSHKYIKKGCGVFNCEPYKDKILIEDIDVIYTGKLEDDHIKFYKNTIKRKDQFISIWNFETNTDKDYINIKDITFAESSSKLKPQIPINTIFNSPVIFSLEERELLYGVKSSTIYSDLCLDPCNLKLGRQQHKRSDPPVKVNKIYISNNNFYFSSNGDNPIEYYKFSYNRVPYSYKFPN